MCDSGLISTTLTSRLVLFVHALLCDRNVPFTRSFVLVLSSACFHFLYPRCLVYLRLCIFFTSPSARERLSLYRD